MSLNDLNISIIDLKLPPVTLDHLSIGELETVWEAGNRILDCCRVLEKIDAQELLRIGYLTEVVEEKELHSRIDKLCESISELSPNAVALTKKAINELSGNDPDIQQIQESHIASTRSADHQEAMLAIREGRPPRFLAD